MLQQTRVQAVIPYYEKFLRHFPEVRTLAAASEQELLACWSGLGYYSRARNLQRAARVIVEKHGGKFPREFEQALALPGIGNYTASAVLSIAYGVPLAVLDGNVARVISRLYALAADAKSKSGNEKLQELAGALISQRRPGEFNQAMMELGATVCLPQQPRCGKCPIQRNCLAYGRSQVDRYPPPRKKSRPVVRHFVAVLILDNAGRFFVVQRPRNANWLGGLWELPMWEKPHQEPPDWLKLEKRLGTVRHSITDNRLEVDVFRGSVNGGNRRARGRWIAIEETGFLPITTITRKALALVGRS